MGLGSKFKTVRATARRPEASLQRGGVGLLAQSAAMDDAIEDDAADAKA